MRGRPCTRRDEPMCGVAALNMRMPARTRFAEGASVEIYRSCGRQINSPRSSAAKIREVGRCRGDFAP